MSAHPVPSVPIHFLCHCSKRPQSAPFFQNAPAVAPVSFGSDRPFDALCTKVR